MVYAYRTYRTIAKNWETTARGWEDIANKAREEAEWWRAKAQQKFNGKKRRD